MCVCMCVCLCVRACVCAHCSAHLFVGGAPPGHQHHMEAGEADDRYKEEARHTHHPHAARGRSRSSTGGGMWTVAFQTWNVFVGTQNTDNDC